MRNGAHRGLEHFSVVIYDIHMEVESEKTLSLLHFSVYTRTLFLFVALRVQHHVHMPSLSIDIYEYIAFLLASYH